MRIEVNEMGGGMGRLKVGFCISMAVAMLVSLAGGARAQSGGDLGQGRAVVTIMPSQPNAPAVSASAQQFKAKVNGKDASVTGWTPLREANSPLELVVLMDGSARFSLTDQYGAITGFVNEMPPNTKIAIAYMEEGRAVMAGPLSSDPAVVLKGLHMPAGTAGTNGSPYFCLSDLAKNWPSHDGNARREVVMITDGVDNYSPHYDPDDQYVQASIRDSVRAGLVVYALYWHNQGRIDNTSWADNAGQNLLVMVTEATGGINFYEGMGNPVSFEPYFQNLRIRLRNQYALTFTAPLHGKPAAEQLQLKGSIPGAKINAPQQVWVSAAERAQN
jgi:hypothetical protein